ncbi:MAG: hypothetical protein LBH61_05795, partial [Dysgonamonadaceae bacterium]|nr:hypothetical protein [Dysgonamonadaceae bacterium]
MKPRKINIPLLISITGILAAIAFLFAGYRFSLLLLSLVALYLTCLLIRPYLPKNRIRNEEWLPVVDATGKVYGKVALSMRDALEGKHLHPVIRIVLLHKGMLFLKARTFSAEEPPLLDYPFERHLRFKETLEEGVLETLLQNGGSPDLPSRFIFKYVCESNNANRLIYLFACNLPEDRST